MNIQLIKKIIKDQKEFELLKAKKETIVLLIIGSIVRQEFISGWSDIDLILLAENFSSDYLKIIAALKEKIKKETNLKTGIALFPYHELLSSICNIRLAQPFFVYAKNFTRDSQIIKDNPVYLKTGYSIPLFNPQDLEKIPIDFYIFKTNEYMINYLSSGKNLRNKKAVLRKIIKNTLFLMQVYLLKKERIIDHDFTKIIEDFAHYSTINIDKLIKSYNKRTIWESLYNKDILNEEIEDNWIIFKSIFRQIYRLC